MECSEIIEQYLELDNGEALPMDVVEHMEHCSSCRRLVTRMAFAMAQLPELAAPVGYEPSQTPSVTEAIFARLEREIPGVSFEPRDRPVSLGGWVVVGILIVAGIVATSFSGPLRWMSDAVGSGIDFPLNLVLGVVLSAYLLLFVGSHVKLISRWLHLRPSTK